jgi:hypothetical protein
MFGGFPSGCPGASTHNCTNHRAGSCSQWTSYGGADCSARHRTGSGTCGHADHIIAQITRSIRVILSSVSIKYFDHGRRLDDIMDRDQNLPLTNGLIIKKGLRFGNTA